MLRGVQRYQNIVISGLAHHDAPIIVTSAELEAPLASTYERLGMAPGLLEGLSGIRERRVWDLGVQPSDVAAIAAERAVHDAGLQLTDIGVLINTSVCRDYIEPSTASIVHGKLGLSSDAMNFDLGNACLGFLNGMNVVAAMIERGEIDHGLIVDGEGSRYPVEQTVQRLSAESCTNEMFREQFATLTLGSGAVAMVLSRAGITEQQHTLHGSISRAATEHAGLCVGEPHEMRTDTRGLLLAGLKLSASSWAEALALFDWTAEDIDTFAMHQVSKVHTAAITETLGIDVSRAPLIFDTHGNIGPAAVPIVLSKARESGTLHAGSRVLMMGIGSGINTALMEVTW